MGNKVSNIDGTIDINRYATKKTAAQGLLDIALLTSSARQLKLLLEAVVGILLIVTPWMNIEDKNNIRKANIIGNVTTLVIFIMAFLSIFIEVFQIPMTRVPLVPNTTITPLED